MRLLIATSNTGKFEEFKRGLAPLGWELLSLKTHPIRLPEETGATFFDNALLKAAYAATQSGLPTLSDDSGLEVEALGGEPGVLSARFGGKKTDLERNLYLLDRLKHLPAPERKARFVSVLVLAYPDGHLESYRGETEGLVLEAPIGENGFGYDPLFWVPAAGKTFAQMTLEEKEAYSHRGKAMRAILNAYQNGEPKREISKLD